MICYNATEMPWCSIEIQLRQIRGKNNYLKIPSIAWLDQIFSYGLLSKHPLGQSPVSHLFQSYHSLSVVGIKQLFCGRSMFTQSSALWLTKDTITLY